MKKKVIKLTERDLENIVKKVIREDERHELSLMDKIKIKIAGISDDQVIYNLNNGLPIDWEGTAEGYREKMEGTKNYSGSN